MTSLGIVGSKMRKAVKDLAEEVEQGSFWHWLWRKDRAWGKQGILDFPKRAWYAVRQLLGLGIWTPLPSTSQLKGVAGRRPWYSIEAKR